MKNLQFGTSKCVKMHIGKSCNEALFKYLFVGGWKVKVETDEVSESYGGLEKMSVKHKQLYLGDIISSDSRHSSNIQTRKIKGQGVINQIMDILQSVFFGKYYFLSWNIY